MQVIKKLKYIFQLSFVVVAVVLYTSEAHSFSVHDNIIDNMFFDYGGEDESSILYFYGKIQTPFIRAPAASPLLSVGIEADVDLTAVDIPVDKTYYFGVEWQY